MNHLELFEERLAIMEFDGHVAKKHLAHLAGIDAFPFLPMTQEQAREFKTANWNASKAVRLLARKDAMSDARCDYGGAR